MLPARLRLRGREDFDQVFRLGKAIFEPEAGIFSKKTENAAARVGFAFKQKVFPRATKRHFLKRKASAALYMLKDELPPGRDIVFLFHKPLPEMTYTAILGILKRLIQRLNKEKK